jgi:hypothetical protein
VLLKALPLDQIILSMGCALCEMKIVVLSPDTHVVSGCLLALVHLLRPLRWAGNIVVTLPPFLHELLESPSFWCMGMDRLPPNLEISQGMVVIDPVKRQVRCFQPLLLGVQNRRQFNCIVRLISFLHRHL